MITPEIDPHADQLRLVEALLFASAAPLDEDSLKERLPEGVDVAGLVAELEEYYRPRGVNIVRVANGWALRTAADLGPRLNLERKVARKLSRAAIETLAILAYHQPVTRAEIEDIRGVVISKGTLDTLMELGWIAPRGRKQTVGRPVTWGTTEAFLLHFGLASIADLPGVEELRATGLIGPRVTSLRETVHPHEIEREEPAEDEPEVESLRRDEPEDDPPEAVRDDDRSSEGDEIVEAAALAASDWTRGA
jgi:segregation and condensation protein B